MGKGTCVNCFFLARLSKSSVSITLDSLPSEMRKQVNKGQFQADWDYICFHHLWTRPTEDSVFTRLLKRPRSCPVFVNQNRFDSTTRLEAVADMLHPSRKERTTPSSSPIKTTKSRSKDVILYTLSYEGMSLIAAGKFKNHDGRIVRRKLLLTRPDLHRENDIIISFLFKKPNKLFSRAEIQTAIRDQGEVNFTLHKSFSKIAENLGFKKEFRVFMTTGKDSIILHNPVKRDDLKPFGITYLSIPS